jgi:Family of unknown function (DUF6402)
MSLTLINIPRIMSSRGWVKGAALMNRWFRNGPATAPRYTIADTITIRMDWILGFTRAKQVYDALIADAIWANPAAQKEIAKMLKRKTLPASGATKAFGNLSDTAQNQHNDYVNFRAFTDGGGYGNYYGAYYGYYGYSSDVMDDLTAALGRFVFHAVVAGEVTASAGTGARTYQVTVREVGIYVRDTYDFNGSQPLGFWDDSDNSVSMLNFLSGTYVSNDSFRDWRAANHRGGDFEIFTDLRRIVLPRPAVFTIA